MLVVNLVAILIVCGPILLIRWKKFPNLGKMISLSWLAGILALIPGLMYVEIYPTIYPIGCDGRSLFSCLFNGVTPKTIARGWPLTWLIIEGHPRFNPQLSILVDIAVVAWFMFVALSLIALLKHWFPIRENRTVNLFVVLVFTFFPLWGRLIWERFFTSTPDFLLQDDFTSNQNLWALQATVPNSNRQYETTIVGGQFVWRLSCGSDVSCEQETEFPNLQVKNFQLDLDTQIVSTTNLSRVLIAIKFRYKDTLNYYEAYFANNGLYAIFLVKDGNLETLKQDTKSVAILTDLSVINHYRIIVGDDRFRFYINNELLAEVENSNFTESGRIFLTVTADNQTGFPKGAIVLFDNLAVMETH